jgi:hypothetical protein
MVVAPAAYGGRRDGARPTAPLHSIAEEIGRGVCWRVMTDEHFCRRKGEGGMTAGRDETSGVLSRRDRCRYLCRRIAAVPYLRG